MGNITNNINPDHYKKECSLECIESMELIFGEGAVLNFCICNAWKYIWRWKNKNGKEDLYKAHWYIDRAFKYSDHMPAKDHDILSRMIDYLTTMTNAESEDKTDKKANNTIGTGELYEGEFEYGKYGEGH